MSIFDIVIADVKARLNPMNAHNGFQGATATMPSGDIINVIDEQEDYVCSRIPQKYQALLYHIPGEILVGAGRTQAGATGGETTLQLSLYPCSNVLIYRNFTGIWRTRSTSNALAAGDYVVDEDTGEITLATPLSRGDRVIATYDHTGMAACKLLRRIITDLSATEIARRVHRSVEQFDIYQDWATQAYADLKRMERDDDGKLSIKFFDKIDLVDETNSSRSVAGNYDVSGGGYL